MSQITVKRTIDASVEKVFETVSNINNFSKAIPHITKVQILSDVKSGVRLRFRETRLTKGKETTEELEVTEFVDNDHVRIVCDSHGTVWDSLFSVAPAEGQTELTLTMDARSYKLLSKLMTPLIKGMIVKALEQDMDSVKRYCEGQSFEFPGDVRP